jgi:hypothetical protein
MMQIYFLSIFFNILAGYTLISEDDNNAPEIKIGFSFKDETVKLILGILAMAAGVLKLLSPAEGSVLILGDLFPAATGFAAGFILCFEYYQKRKTVSEEAEKKAPFVEFLLQNRKIAGFAAIATAILHFIFPGIFFL